MAGPVQVGLSDVVTVIKTALWIKEHCFTFENQADRRYRELRDQFERFSNVLLRFEEVSRRRPARILSLNNRDIGPADFGPGCDLDLPGFQLTLQDCKALLEKYPALDNKKSSRVGDAIWHLRAEPKAADIRNRLHSHHDHILIQIGLLNLDFAYEQSQSQDDLREILRAQSTPSIEPGPRISEELESHFYTAFKLCEEYGISTENLPFDETLKVVHQHLIRSNPDSEQNQFSSATPTRQCLSLLKAKWLLKLVEESAAFRREPQQSRQRHWVTYTSTTTIPQRCRLPLFSDISDGALQVEFSTDPEIWIIEPEPEPAPPERVDSNIRHTLEDHVATVKLQTGELRISQVDENVLRLEPARIVYFNLHADNLVPWYSFKNTKEIMLKSSMNIPGEIFSLKTRAHVLKMQAAFVEYDVCSPKEVWDNVRITVTTKKGMLFGQEDQIGETQLWNWPKKGSIEHTGLGGSILSSNQSFSSGSTQVHSLATNMTGGLNPTIFTLYESESEKGGAIFAKLPPPPLLVCFTREKEVYSIWRVDCK